MLCFGKKSSSCPMVCEQSDEASRQRDPREVGCSLVRWSATFSSKVCRCSHSLIWTNWVGVRKRENRFKLTVVRVRVRVRVHVLFGLPLGTSAFCRGAPFGFRSLGSTRRSSSRTCRRRRRTLSGAGGRAGGRRLRRGVLRLGLAAPLTDGVPRP